MYKLKTNSDCWSGEMIGELTGVLSTSRTHELWVPRQAYCARLKSFCFVYSDVSVLRKRRCSGSELGFTVRGWESRVWFISCLSLSLPANQKLCYWRCAVSSTSWHSVLIRGIGTYFPISSPCSRVSVSPATLPLSSACDFPLLIFSTCLLWLCSCSWFELAMVFVCHNQCYWSIWVIAFIHDLNEHGPCIYTRAWQRIQLMN